ncbi:cellulose-binding protein [Phlyctema vagabunda]|uniref:Cellulose-binding protein n=1 Tax=Phlyctema vagabunda TaxID=108571 RepID=A0ABR4PQU6_9HELO
MAWSTTGNTTGTNHAPIAIVNNTCGPDHLEYSIPIGQSLKLDASQSWDPDGDAITFSWFTYDDITPNARAILRAGGKLIDFSPQNTAESIIEITPVLNATVHIILAVSDSREKSLIAYRRILITSS